MAKSKDSQNFELPKGEPLRPNEWSEPGAWVLAVLLALLGTLTLIHQTSRGQGARIMLGIAYLLFAGLLTRAALTGVVIEPGGIKVRTLWRNYRWRWEEIEAFSLCHTTYRSNLRIQLREGGYQKANGLTERTRKERERAESIVQQLNQQVGPRGSPVDE